MNNKRIIIVDALRGFALLLIVLIHYIEHFELFAQPDSRWLIPASVDNKVFQGIMFIIGGKAYSIFALMFGFSFFIQLNRSEQKGVDFRGRFAWRLAILLAMGFFHSLIYKGDILHIYALMGFMLLPLYKLRIKHLLIIGAFFLLQIPTILHTAYAFIKEGYEFTPSWGWGLWQEADKTFSTGSFWDVISFNFWTGRTTVWGWTFYTGRYLQLFGLFIAGLIIGKTRFFENLELYKPLIVRTLILSPLVYAAFMFVRNAVNTSDFNDLQKQMVGGLIHMYANIAFTLFYVAALILLHLQFKQAKMIKSLAAYGKMSLTNYVTQAVFGVVFFYEFGFGMFKHMGATWSLLMGISFYILQVEFSKYWINHYYYGPLEWFWRALTLRDFSIKFKRENQVELEPSPVKVFSNK